LYGACNEVNGEAKERFLKIDQQGIIQWSYLSDIYPGADGVLEALEKKSHLKY
jgi:hypothetical protein